MQNGAKLNNNATRAHDEGLPKVFRFKRYQRHAPPQLGTFGPIGAMGSFVHRMALPLNVVFINQSVWVRSV